MELDDTMRTLNRPDLSDIHPGDWWIAGCRPPGGHSRGWHGWIAPWEYG